MFNFCNLRQSVFSSVFTFLLLVSPSVIYASDSKVSWQFDLGLAAQHRTILVDSLDSYDGDFTAALLLAGGVYYEDFFLETSPFRSQPLTLGYTLNTTKSTQVNLIGMSWFSTISEEEQDQGDMLDDLLVRRSSFEVGIEYLKKFNKSDLSVRLLHDALNRHGGSIFAVDQSRPIYKTDWLIIPSWGLAYLSENIVDFYYGINAQEARLDRPMYKAGGGWSLTGRVYVERPLNENWTLFGFASYSKFSNSITDSPIVSVDNSTHTMAVGVLWSF